MLDGPFELPRSTTYGYPAPPTKRERIDAGGAVRPRYERTTRPRGRCRLKESSGASAHPVFCPVGGIRLPARAACDGPAPVNGSRASEREEGDAEDVAAEL